MTFGFQGFKGDERKALLAALLRRPTAVGFEWIATRLGMGHPGSTSRQVGNVKRDGKLENQINELEKMLQCGDWFQRWMSLRPLRFRGATNSASIRAMVLTANRSVRLAWENRTASKPRETAILAGP
jgi:hypothetical protein